MTTQGSPEPTPISSKKTGPLPKILLGMASVLVCLGFLEGVYDGFWATGSNGKRGLSNPFLFRAISMAP